MTDWYNLSWSDVVNLLQSNSNMGLKDIEVLKNRELYGSNVITGVEKSKRIRDNVKQFIKPWSISIIGAFVLFLCIHRFWEALFAAITVIANIVIIIIAKHKEQKKMQELGSFNLGSCNVIRNGKMTSIPNTEVVLGDIVLYSKGSIIPADLRIMDCENLKVKETFITGDNNVIDKYSAKLLENELNLSEMRNILFKSTVVQKGSGEGIAVGVGMNTEIGKSMQSLLEIEEEENVFYKGIQEIADTLSLIGIVSTIIMFTAKFITKVPINNIIEYAAMMLLVIVPFEIPVILYMLWMILNRHLKKEEIFLNSLSVIRDISNINAICTDKECVLTEEFMVLKKIYDTDQIVTTYDNNFYWNDNLRRIMEIGILCNDSNPNDESNSKSDMAEKAIIAFAVHKKMDTDEIQIKQRRIFETPYDKEKRIKTTINKVERKYRAYVKGAVDALIEECTHIMKNGVEKEITPEDIMEIKENDIIMSNECLNVIGLAYRNFTYQPSISEKIESNLVFAGLMGFNNPIKQNVKDAIEKSRVLAVKPVIITEDSKLTAIAVGKSIGAVNLGDVVLSGIEVENAKTDELERNIEKNSIFSRINSSQKLKLINLYKNKGYNVALTGSKHTDLPSLKVAGISVAFGRKCSDMVKKLSDVYISSINLLKLIDLTEESRNVMNSLSEIIKFFCVCSLSEFFLCILISIFSGKIPLTVMQVLWLNIINMSISAAVIFKSRESLKTSEYKQNTIDKKLWKNSIGDILFCSISLAIIILIAYNFSNKFNGKYTSGIIFTLLCFGQIIILNTKALIPELKLNIYALILVLCNIIVIGTGLSGYLITLKQVNLFGIETILVAIFIQILILQIKKLFNIFGNNDNIEEI